MGEVVAQMSAAPIRYSICQKCGALHRWRLPSGEVTRCPGRRGRPCGETIRNPNEFRAEKP